MASVADTDNDTGTIQFTLCPKNKVFQTSSKIFGAYSKRVPVKQHSLFSVCVIVLWHFPLVRTDRPDPSVCKENETI